MHSTRLYHILESECLWYSRRTNRRVGSSSCVLDVKMRVTLPFRTRFAFRIRFVFRTRFAFRIRFVFSVLGSCSLFFLLMSESRFASPTSKILSPYVFLTVFATVQHTHYPHHRPIMQHPLATFARVPVADTIAPAAQQNSRTAQQAMHGS